jgi:8-oxo-dGTP pyrophosphatase MutT (NUDIX family)
MAEELLTTWDGIPISPEPPFGALVVVYCETFAGLRFLILHRAHHGPAYEGDWAWTPPSGSRLPGEPIDGCAQRELLEETGLRLPLRSTACGTSTWHVYLAELPPEQLGSGAAIVLDAEHDRYEWVSLESALARCLPAQVGQSLRRVAQQLGLL